MRIIYLSESEPKTVNRLNAYYQERLDEQSAKPYAMPDPLMGELARRRSQ